MEIALLSQIKVSGLWGSQRSAEKDYFVNAFNIWMAVVENMRGFARKLKPI